MGVEVIEPFPSLIEANQSWYEHNFASIAQNHRLPFGFALAFYGATAFDFPGEGEDETLYIAEGERREALEEKMSSNGAAT
ncbi:hypothetical protein ACFXTH_014983 [Malus domestica]